MLWPNSEQLWFDFFTRQILVLFETKYYLIIVLLWFQVIVTHTPKTLREILSTLFQLLLGCLASSSYDKRQVR